MISSALMDGCYLRRVIIFCCFSHLIFDALAAAGHSENTRCDESQRWSKTVIYSTGGQEMFLQTLAEFPAAAKRVDTASVYLSYELYSLLW